MKELFTKNFWKGVQKTYEEAQKAPPPAPKPAIIPVPEKAEPKDETATSRQEAV